MKHFTYSLNMVILLMVLTFYKSFAQITISSPSSSSSITACTNYYNLYYHATGSFSTYVVAEVHQNNSSGPIVKTYSNVYSGYLSADYNNSVSSTGLSPGNYQIKIYDYYNPSFYGWSSIFTISPLSAPSSLSLIRNYGSYFEINWTCAVTGVFDWRVDVATTSNFQPSTILPSYNDYHATGSECGGFYVTGINGSTTTYYVRVRAANNCSTSANSSTLAVAPCSTHPAPVATAATSVGPASFIAHWNTVSGVAQYELVVTRSGDSPITHQVNSTSYTFSPAHPSSSYTYKVRSVECGKSGDSNVISVNTPSLGTPVFGSAGGDSDERWINWTTVTGAKYYDFQVSQVSNFSTLWYHSTVSITNETFDADICETYYLRVRAQAETGEYGPFSTAFNWGPSGLCGFAASPNKNQSIAQTSVASEVDREQEFAFFPNPVENYLRITLPIYINAQTADFEVSDIYGHLIHLPIQPFKESVELDTSNVPAGLYVVSNY